MPTISVTLPANGWNREQKEDVACRLAEAFNGAAEAAGKGDVRPYITVEINEAAEGGYSFGGKILG